MKLYDKVLFFALAISITGCGKYQMENAEAKICYEKIEIAATEASFKWMVDFPGKVSSVVEVSSNEDMSDSKCYGSEEETDNKTFIVKVSTLDCNSVYYYRYRVWNHYYLNNPFVFEVNSFSTNGLSVVRTASVIGVTWNTAIGQGDVISEGGAAIIEKGFCWSEEMGPTIDDLHTASYSDTCTYSVIMAGLKPSTIYYARAYVINEVGICYGDEVSFKTVPIGAINGAFSIDSEKKVFFSKGNLQYQASSNIWRFADRQYDFIGRDNCNASQTYTEWIDLFGWGTSNYFHGALCFQPWAASVNNNDYFAYGIDTCDLYDYDGKADWGHNAIINGGNRPGLWRTLSQEEWNYLLELRNTTSGIRFVKAKVLGKTGLLLLPDDWDDTNFVLNNTNVGDADFNHNVISAEQWNIIEQYGVVFLPVAGYKNGTSYVSSVGYYWTSTHQTTYSTNNAYSLAFYYHANPPSYGNCSVGYNNRYWGHAVRLVRDME